MKKLLAMLGATGLVVSTGAILVSCNEKAAPEAKVTELEMTVPVAEAIELTTVEMGLVTTSDDEATAITGVELKEGSTLSEDGKTLNITLLISEDVIAGKYKSEIIADKAVPPVSREDEDAKVHLPFEFTVKANLSTVIKVTALGELDDFTLPTITSAIKAANTPVTKEAPDFGTLAFKEGVEPTETTATMVSDKFDGEVVVTYTIKEAGTTDPELKTIIKVTDLKELANKDAETILKAVKEKNVDAKDAKLEVTGILEGEATINATEGYTGEVKVTFTLTPAKDPELKTIIKVTDLGDLADKEPATILKAVKEKNVDAKDAKLEVTGILEGEATINATEGYEGTVKVTFKIKTETENPKA